MHCQWLDGVPDGSNAGSSGGQNLVYSFQPNSVRGAEEVTSWFADRSGFG